MKTLESQLDETLGTERLIAALSAAFGVLATLLAAIGLYGVMAFVVERRTKELGVRMALGAQQGRIIWLVMREVFLLLAIGLAIGVPSAYLLSRYVSSQLFGVTATDHWDRHRRYPCARDRSPGRRLCTRTPGECNRSDPRVAL